MNPSLGATDAFHGVGPPLRLVPGAFFPGGEDAGKLQTEGVARGALLRSQSLARG